MSSSASTSLPRSPLPELAITAFATVAQVSLLVALLLGVIVFLAPSGPDGGAMQTLLEALDPSMTLIAFAIAYVSGLLGLCSYVATVRPEGEEAVDCLQVAFFTGPLRRRASRELGGVWLSTSALHFVTRQRHLTLPLGSIREIRVVPERARLLGRLGLVADHPLVIDFDDGRKVEVFVCAPKFLAAEILAARDAGFERAQHSPYRSGVAAG